MGKLFVSASPHITSKKNTTRNIMLEVIIALMPLVIAATYFFGYHVIINVVICVAACMGSELLFTLFMSRKFSKDGVKKSTMWDFSSAVTGIILALNLPSKLIVKGWDLNFYASGKEKIAENILFSFDTVLVCIIGSIFAIMLVKMLFGGIGRNFANPAVTARIFLMLTFGLAAINTAGLGLTASTGATWLSTVNKSTSNQKMFLNMFLGNRGSAAVGETCMIALIVGYVYLSVRKIIDFRIPLMIIASAALFAFLFEAVSKPSAAKIANNVFANIMAGGLVFGAIFMATDYSTSPNTFWGQVIFAVGIGFFTIVIRVFTKMPEGMSFAILLMNIVTPLIDRYLVPRPFGYIKPERFKRAGKKPGSVLEPEKIKLGPINHSEKNKSEVSV